MIAKRLEDITVIDLQELIDNEVGESRTIEYKSELHFEKGDERREFLADVTSFANTDGGDLIYGIREDAESNLPIKLVGIAVDNEDDLIRKIESLLRDSISPRIPEIGFHMVSLACETSILIIRIGISFLSPHRVIYKGYDKFFARHAKGKYQMDVMELRSAFTMAQTLTKEIDQYKTSRLKTIFENKYQELSDGYPIFVMQSIPISSFRKNRLYSVKEVTANAPDHGVHLNGGNTGFFHCLFKIGVCTLNPTAAVNLML